MFMLYNESEKISSIKYLHWVLPLITSSVTRNNRLQRVDFFGIVEMFDDNEHLL